MALADTARLIASLELQDKFSGPARGVDRSISGLERSTGRLTNIGQSASRGLSSLGANLTKFAAVGVGVATVIGIKSVQAASDLNEEVDKAKVVFGDAADEVLRFADGSAKIGLAKSEALGAAGAFGNMFRTTGLATGEAAEMSTTMVQLAADMASFNNEDPSEMLDKLRSGLSGEAEPLRRFGVLLSEATVKEFAYRNGIAKTGEALTEVQKVQARYGLILEQTAIQQGNFADTSDSLANQQRQLRANLQNTAAVIGTALLPSVGKVAKAINEAFIRNQPAIERFGRKVGRALEGLFTDQNISKGIDKVSGFIDTLSRGDFGNATGNLSSVISGVGSLPWESIGDAARLLGTGSKALLDAFLGLPPWVQTAVLTGWGLNKLTGGALGGILGGLTQGLGKWITQKLGLMTVQAGVVHVNGPGGGGPGGTPTGGGLRGFATGAIATAGVAAVSTGGFLAASDIDKALATGSEEGILKGAATFWGGPGALITRAVEELLPPTKGIEATGKAMDQELGLHTASLRHTIPEAQRTRAEIIRLNSNEGSRAAAAHARLEGIRGTQAQSNATLAQIRDKRQSVNVTVHTSTSVSLAASEVALRVQQLTQTVQGPRVE